MSRLTIISTVILCALVALFFGLWRYEVLSHSKTSDALTAVKAGLSQCKDNIEISERVNNDYQNDINRLNADMRRLRSKPSKCVHISRPSSVHTGSGSGGQHGSQNGISSEWLFEYAATAEQLRLQRNACKDFVNKTWETNK